MINPDILSNYFKEMELNKTFLYDDENIIFTK